MRRSLGVALSRLKKHRARQARARTHDLARLAGVGPVFGYDVESGKSTLRLDTLLDLLEVLGLDDLR